MDVFSKVRDQDNCHQVLLDDYGVTVFQINSNFDNVTIANLSKVLSVEEARRAERFRFENDRRRFIVTRGSLRELLGSNLGKLPQTVNISYTQLGKPFLDEMENQIYFNVSHSHDISLIAMSTTKVVGIDVEFVKNGNDFLRVAERVFSPEEYENLRDVSTASDFYYLWTRREAFVKALGTGLSDFGSFQCLTGKNGYFRPVKLTLPGLDGECSVVSIPTDSDYRAALTWINVLSGLQLR